MTDDPVELDERRGMAAQKATGIRRQRLRALLTGQATARRREEELERLLDTPTDTLPAVAAKVQHLMELFADTKEAQDPRRKKLMAQALDGLTRLCDRAAGPS